MIDSCIFLCYSIFIVVLATLFSCHSRAACFLSHPRAAAEGQPETAAAQKLVIILIKPAARQVVLIQQVLVPADLIRFLTAVAELAHDVNLVVTPLLLTGVPFIQPVTAIVVKTEPWNHVILSVEDPDARLVAEVLAEAPVLPDIHGKEQITTGVMLAGNFLKMYILLFLMNIV